jgi:hypothetical protein
MKVVAVAELAARPDCSRPRHIYLERIKGQHTHQYSHSQREWRVLTSVRINDLRIVSPSRQIEGEEDKGLGSRRARIGVVYAKTLRIRKSPIERQALPQQLWGCLF